MIENGSDVTKISGAVQKAQDTFKTIKNLFTE